MYSYDVKQHVKIAFLHNPYLLKKSCVEIIQFIELHTRFHLYDQYETHGFNEQVKWESLVSTYLELLHSYIDIQRKASKEFERLSNKDYSSERTNIIGTPSIEHAIIMEARRAVHHYAYSITSFSAVPGENNKSLPSPNIKWHTIELSEEQTNYVNEELFWGGDKLSNFFSNHCSQFIQKSSKIGSLYLNHLENSEG